MKELFENSDIHNVIGFLKQTRLSSAIQLLFSFLVERFYSFPR